MKVSARIQTENFYLRIVLSKLLAILHMCKLLIIYPVLQMDVINIFNGVYTIYNIIHEMSVCGQDVARLF